MIKNNLKKHYKQCTAGFKDLNKVVISPKVQTNVCPICCSYMLEKNMYLRCSCGYAEKVSKRHVTPR